MKTVPAWLGFAALGLLSSACSDAVRQGDFDRIARVSRPEVGAAPLRVMWNRPLLAGDAVAYVPVERASATLSPTADRVFVGSTRGDLWALDASGRRRWVYRSGSPIAAAPALDIRRDELYLPTDGGGLHALRATRPEERWTHAIRETIGQPPLLTDDSVYVVTDVGSVLALSRANGEVLWRYRRELPEGIQVAGHAGLTQVGERIITGFADGSVVALDAADGRVLWDRDLSLDVDLPTEGLPRFVDVDTTPVLVDDQLFVASFAAGVYGLSPSNGSILWREAELTGVTSITHAENRLLLSSADRGVTCLALPTRDILWTRTGHRGAPSGTTVANGMVYVGETEGALLSLDLTNGQELSRFESGTGFTAKPAIENGLGFVLSNGANLFAFTAGRSAASTDH